MGIARREFVVHVGAASLAAGLSGGASSVAASSASAEQSGSREAVPHGRVVYNLDSDEFFVGTFGDPVPETIGKFVEAHAALGITDLFINVNAQHTNYRSDVWESAWDGYDPTAGDDQPFFAGIDPKRKFEAQLSKNVLALDQQDCDFAKTLIDLARHVGWKAWISVRMNDSHYSDQPDHPYHSTFWRSHPQWHLLNKCLDYEQPEVREHFMKLIGEVCNRYDVDGVELDFLRFPLYFRPGHEHEGAKLMTAFVEQVRRATQKAAHRWQHSVELAVRVPTTPWIARRHGLDAIAGPRQDARRHVHDVPAGALSDGYNLIEVSSPVDVKITWVEIAVR